MPFRNSPALDHATDRLTDDHQFNFIISISLHSLHTIIFLAPHLHDTNVDVELLYHI